MNNDNVIKKIYQNLNLLEEKIDTFSTMSQNYLKDIQNHQVVYHKLIDNSERERKVQQSNFYFKQNLNSALEKIKEYGSKRFYFNFDEYDYFYWVDQLSKNESNYIQHYQNELRSRIEEWGVYGRVYILFESVKLLYDRGFSQSNLDSLHNIIYDIPFCNNIEKLFIIEINKDKTLVARTSFSHYRELILKNIKISTSLQSYSSYESITKDDYVFSTTKLSMNGDPVPEVVYFETLSILELGNKLKELNLLEHASYQYSVEGYDLVDLHQRSANWLVDDLDQNVYEKLRVLIREKIKNDFLNGVSRIFYSASIIIGDKFIFELTCEYKM